LGDYGDLAARIQKQSDARQAYFNQLTEQLKARRYGPSASERLAALSVALAKPTSTPGFGGMLANVTPVFEQYAKDKRAAEAARASDMEKLGLARLNMGDDEVKTALELQRLRAQYAKDAAPKLDALPGGGYQQQPGTGGAPPYPNSDDNGVYIIEDPRQLKYLPPNSPIRRPNDPMVKYTPGV
tara:strand:- start:2568 stop:3119 length:552 start_codon:yes stop_codon:yes gene_type:complete